MTTIDDLEKVLLTEIELAEALLVTLNDQREAIMYAHTERLTAALDRCDDLAKPIEALEEERLRMVAEIMSGVRPGRGSDHSASLTELAEHLNPDDAARISILGKRLRLVVGRILSMNRENKPLIDHALRFVRENLRIIREVFPQQLVDQRI